MSRVSSRRHSVLARGRATAKGVSGAFGSPSFTWVVCLQEPAQRPGPGTGTAAAAAPLQPWAHPHSRSPPGSLAGQSPGCAGRGLQRTAAGAPGHAAGVLPWWRREAPLCVKGGVALLDCTQHQQTGLPAQQQSSTLKQHALHATRRAATMGLPSWLSCTVLSKSLSPSAGGQDTAARPVGHAPAGGGQGGPTHHCKHWKPCTAVAKHFACHHDRGLCAAPVHCRWPCGSSRSLLLIRYARELLY